MSVSLGKRRMPSWSDYCARREKLRSQLRKLESAVTDGIPLPGNAGEIIAREGARLRDMDTYGRVIGEFAFDVSDVSGLNDQQRVALEAMASGHNTLILGPAGTGKTYLLEHFHPPPSLGEIIISASTGKAAASVHGCTVHSLLHDPRLATASYLVIEEAFMLSPKFMADFSAHCSRVRDTKAPFGGLVVIALADPCQLSPVYPDLEPGALPPLLHSHADFSKWFHKVVTLSTIVRQGRRADIELLARCRYGLPLSADQEAHIESLRCEDDSAARIARCCKRARDFGSSGMSSEARQMLLFGRNAEAAEFNRQVLSQVATLGPEFKPLDLAPGLMIKHKVEGRYEEAVGDKQLATLEQRARTLGVRLPFRPSSAAATAAAREVVSMPKVHTWLQRLACEAVRDASSQVQRVSLGMDVLLTVNLCPEAGLINGTSGVIVGYLHWPVTVRSVYSKARSELVAEHKKASEDAGSGADVDEGVDGGVDGGNESGPSNRDVRNRLVTLLEAAADDCRSVPDPGWPASETTVVIVTSNNRRIAVPRVSSIKRLGLGKLIPRKPVAGSRSERLWRGFTPGEEWAAEATSVPIMLCAGGTVHKAQGMTLDSGAIGPGMTQYGQLYVALSRFRRLEPGSVSLIGEWKGFWARAHRDAVSLCMAAESQTGGGTRAAPVAAVLKEATAASRALALQEKERER